MMWELISANRKKSLILFAGMALFLSVLGYMSEPFSSVVKTAAFSVSPSR